MMTVKNPVVLTTKFGEVAVPIKQGTDAARILSYMHKYGRITGKEAREKLGETEGFRARISDIRKAGQAITGSDTKAFFTVETQQVRDPKRENRPYTVYSLNWQRQPKNQ